MTAIDAAYQVLLEAGKPLHCKEITKRILAAGLWETKGKTPWDTVAVGIQGDIKGKGARSRFCQPGPGIFALAAAPDLFPQLSQQPRRPDRPAGSPSGKYMLFLDAAEHVLMGMKDGARLHYRDITARAIADGLLRTEGKTPEATMAAQIGTDIRRREERGETQRFVREGRGMIGLARDLPIGIADQIRQHNVEAREELLERARDGTPDEFEGLVEELLLAMGFEDVDKTRIGQDGGVDVRGTLVVGDVVRIRMAVQAKRWMGTVSAATVQQLRGSLGVHEQGLVITTSKFSAQARKEAERSDASPVALMDGEQLAVLLAQHEVGARRRQHVLITLKSAEHVAQP